MQSKNFSDADVAIETISRLEHEDLHYILPILPLVIEVTRESEYFVVSSIIPIVLINLLVFPVFFIKRRELSTRLQYIVTLYLALAASSFFLEKPKSDHALLPDILGLQAYIILTVCGLESVLAYWLTRREYLTKKHRFRLLHVAHPLRKLKEPSIAPTLSSLTAKARYPQVMHRGGVSVRSSGK